MATMNRNVNLEEINSDAFMGIPYLQYQTILQKGILIGSIVTAIGINLIGSFFWDINTNLIIVITLFPLIAGVAFGCNYNQDLSLIRYLRLFISKPSKAFYSSSTEDIVHLRNSAARIIREEELQKRQQQNVSQEEHKKLLIKLLVGIAISAAALIIALALIGNLKKEEVHHTVATVDYSIETGECQYE